MPMIPRNVLLLTSLLLQGSLASSAGAQAAAPAADSAAVPPLYTQTAPLAVTFTANLGRLRSDKDTNAPWRSATLAYTADTGRVVVPARARTRGIWRLKNCVFPPLRLDFSGKTARGTVFEHVGKPKLVNYCKDTGPYEQWILQEYQLYRVYQLLTPVSYRARLLRIAYADSASGQADVTRYGFLVEDPEQLAKRFGGTVVKMKGATVDDLDPEPLALAYLFEFMIGNTDFSFNGLHNTQLIGTTDGRVLPVAYDFDYAGAVNTTYAVPDKTLRLRSVRERKFRGYCALAEEYPKLLPLFREKKDAIYALYRDDVGRLIDEGRVRETLQYFDEFYAMIATPDQARKAFLNDCVGPH